MKAPFSLVAWVILFILGLEFGISSFEVSSWKFFSCMGWRDCTSLEISRNKALNTLIIQKENVRTYRMVHSWSVSFRMHLISDWSVLLIVFELLQFLLILSSICTTFIFCHFETDLFQFCHFKKLFSLSFYWHLYVRLVLILIAPIISFNI